MSLDSTKHNTQMDSNAADPCDLSSAASLKRKDMWQSVKLLKSNNSYQRPEDFAKKKSVPVFNWVKQIEGMPKPDSAKKKSPQTKKTTQKKGANSKSTKEKKGVIRTEKDCEKSSSELEQLNVHEQVHETEMMPKPDSALVPMKKKSPSTKKTNHKNGAHSKPEEKKDVIKAEKDIVLVEVSGGEHTCSICEKSYNEIEQLNIHEQVHTGRLPFVCPRCFKGFDNLLNFRKHKVLHKKIVTQCILCEKIFLKSSTLKRHMRSHTGEKPYVCTVCGKGFRENTPLKVHMRTHTGETPYVCNLCGKRFHGYTNLYLHIKSHSSAREHMCSICSKSYTSASSLRVHMRTHTGERPYVCEKCGKAYMDFTTLRKHKKIHSGERPWKCHICDKDFIENVQLKKHMMRHNGERPWKCTFCTNAFFSKFHLDKHMRIHTGEKPCICKECGKAFRESGALYRHMRVHGKKRIVLQSTVS